MPNVELLQKTLQYIKDHPKEWDQGLWAAQSTCGTSFCFAGTVCVLEGEEIGWDVCEVPGCTCREGEGDTEASLLKSGERISDYAMDALGLSATQADNLFCGSNSFEDLEEIVMDLCKDAITDEHVMIFKEAEAELEEWEKILHESKPVDQKA